MYMLLLRLHLFFDVWRGLRRLRGIYETWNDAGHIFLSSIGLNAMSLSHLTQTIKYEIVEFLAIDYLMLSFTFICSDLFYVSNS